MDTIPANIYLFKVIDVVLVDVIDVILVLLLLTLSRYHTFF